MTIKDRFNAMKSGKAPDELEKRLRWQIANNQINAVDRKAMEETIRQQREALKIRVGTRLLVTDALGGKHACKVTKIEDGMADYKVVNEADQFPGGGFLVTFLPRLKRRVQVVAF